jgi:glycosyltransferase involved in cell wall biosynthesis
LRKPLKIVPRLEQPLLLFVGRAAHEKIIGFLIEMMQELRRLRPDALLLIAGEGPAEGALRAQASRLGLNGSARFLGYFDRGGELQDCGHPAHGNHRYSGTGPGLPPRTEPAEGLCAGSLRGVGR